MKQLSSLFLLLAISLSLYAEHKVNGTVQDASTGEALIGVTILVKGTTQGTVTDFDGGFSLKVNENDTLQLSYIGYTPVEISIGTRSALGMIKMMAETVSLEDVTITGQMARVSETPVAVSQVTALDIEERLGNREFPEVLKNTPDKAADGATQRYGCAASTTPMWLP